MNCPKDNTQLMAAKVRGIDVDKCPTCAGMWLDAQELDQLEDTVFDEDELKGSLIPSETATSFPCPRCGAALNQFDYRFYDLILERCPNNDGFWLDADEDRRVLEKIGQRAQSMQRKIQAESEWTKVINRWRKKR